MNLYIYIIYIYVVISVCTHVYVIYRDFPFAGKGKTGHMEVVSGLLFPLIIIIIIIINKPLNRLQLESHLTVNK